MESKKVKIIYKINPSNIVQSSNVMKGLFRGFLIGILFAAVIAYVKLVDLNFIGGERNAEEILVKNDTIIMENQQNMAEMLYKEIRILCFIVPISEQDLKNNGHMFLATWTKRCQKVIFFADESYDELKDHVVKIENKQSNWSRLREALAYIYRHHMDDFDWILKATDNSFVIMENLRWLLYQYDTELPIIIGQRFLAEDYMKGPYALSKSGFTKLIESAFTNSEICLETGYDEDKEMSKCLQHINVLQINGINSIDGRGMFFHNRPDELLIPTREDPNFDKWYFHKLSQGIENCCSDRLIAMENVRGTHLYYMEYFIYKVHAVGRHRLFEELPYRKSAADILNN